MHTFDDIKPGARLRGLDPAGIAEVVQVARFGPDALNLVFRVDGRVGEQLVYRGEESGFEILEAGKAYAFDADGALLRLASEAYRIRLAYLFDPYLAVTASQIEALPHQITAVYGEMLPRQPLRFLLADDPGVGKTIMAGLLIKELLIRGDLERCLIIAPGNLVEQSQDEMSEKFGLGFDILTRDQIEASITGNPFVEKNRLILRLEHGCAFRRIESEAGSGAGLGPRHLRRSAPNGGVLFRWRGERNPATQIGKAAGDQSRGRQFMRLIPELRVPVDHIESRAANTGASVAIGVAYLLFALMFVTMIAEIFLVLMRVIRADVAECLLSK